MYIMQESQSDIIILKYSGNPSLNKQVAFTAECTLTDTYK